MQECEFAFMLPRLEAEVTKFTSIQADKRNTYRKKVREEKKAAKDEPESTMPGIVGRDDEPAAKRARLDGEAEEVEDEEVEDDEIEEEEGETQEGMTEDLLEEKEEKDEDDEMADGDESD
jgi:DNA polymerase epsilon subunit 3